MPISSHFVLRKEQDTLNRQVILQKFMGVYTHTHTHMTFKTDAILL